MQQIISKQAEPPQRPQLTESIRRDIEKKLEALWKQRQKEATSFTRSFTKPSNSQVCVSLGEDGSCARVAVVYWRMEIGSGQGHTVYEGIETKIKINRDEEHGSYTVGDWTKAAIGIPIEETWRNNSPCEIHAYHQKVFSIFKGDIAAIRDWLVEPGWLSESPLWWRVQPLCSQTLKQIILNEANRQPLSQYAVKALEAVCYLTEHGITHGDVKADNITVTRDGAIKLLDGELARTEIIACSITQIDFAESFHFDTASSYGVRSPYTDLFATMALMIRCACPLIIPLIIDTRKTGQPPDLTGISEDKVVSRALTVISKDPVWGNSIMTAVQQAIVGLGKGNEESSIAPFTDGVKAWLKLKPQVVRDHTTLYQTDGQLSFKTSDKGKKMKHSWTGACAEDCFALADGTNQLHSLFKIGRWKPKLPADHLWNLTAKQLPLLVEPGKSKEAFKVLQTQAQSMGVWSANVLKEMKKLIGK